MSGPVLKIWVKINFNYLRSLFELEIKFLTGAPPILLVQLFRNCSCLADISSSSKPRYTVDLFFAIFHHLRLLSQFLACNDPMGGGCFSIV